MILDFKTGHRGGRGRPVDVLVALERELHIRRPPRLRLAYVPAPSGARGAAGRRGGARRCASRPNTDEALESFEETLLDEARRSRRREPPPVLAAQELFEGLDDDLARRGRGTRGPAPAGERGAGDPPPGDHGDTVYFLLTGTVSVRMPLGVGP